MGDFLDNRARRNAMKRAEKEGLVADSIEVRITLMKQVKDGTITLAEAQSQLTAIQRGAKKNGLVTRSQAYNGKLPPKGGEGEG